MSKSATKSPASSVFGLLRAYVGDHRGSLAVITAICSTALFAVLAVAIDYVMMTRIQGQLQAAADGAALASVKELRLAGTTEKQIRAVAIAFVRYNIAEEPTKPRSPASTSTSI